MMRDKKQRTIAQPISFSGIGLHCGKEVRAFISPSLPNTGIFFVQNGKRIPALVEKVKETRRGTTLGGIAVVEHFLSAAYALGIDNLQIAVTGEELPALDGSALPFARALLAAGLVEQEALKNPICIAAPIEIAEGEAKITAYPLDGFRLNSVVDFLGIGKQARAFDAKKDNYLDEIAPARTFGYREEYEDLKSQGLARGASLDNALVLSSDGYCNTPRFPDELVRHKILDLLGDLALLGRPLFAEVTAFKSGHKLNVLLVRRILEHAC